jgi:predicted O-methyltransferase YrrM
MSQELYAAVDRYLGEVLIEKDEALEAALATSVAAGLPDIQVSPLAGKFLHQMARVTGARRILEIGTLGGYSTIWLGRAISGRPGAKLITLEMDPRHAGIARGNLARARLDAIVEVREGLALATLPTLLPLVATQGPFDMFFIDADKPSNADYFAWALRLGRAGSVIMVDNVVRRGAIADPTNTAEDVQGTRRLLEAMSAAQREGRISVTALQTVGEKYHDGFAFAVITGG